MEKNDKKLYKNRKSTAEELKKMRQAGPIGREGARDVIKKIQKDSEYIRDKAMSQLQGKVHRLEKENASFKQENNSLRQRVENLEHANAVKSSGGVDVSHDLPHDLDHDALARGEEIIVLGWVAGEGMAAKLIREHLGSASPEILLQDRQFLDKPNEQQLEKQRKLHKKLTTDPSTKKIIFIVEDRAVVVGLGLKSDEAILQIPAADAVNIPNSDTVKMDQEAFLKHIEEYGSDSKGGKSE